MPPLRVILDTDIGTDVDDAIALAFLLASPELDLRLVTTVSGDTVARGRIARKLLALAGRDEVPVAAGIREPVLRRRSFLALGHEGRGIVDAAEPLALSPSHAVDQLIETILVERPHVIAIGPLSNLAVAIMKEPKVIAAIPHLTAMGGILGRAADMPPVEYNFGSDPEATLVVLDAGIPTTLVPLDVTHRVCFTEADMARLRRSASPLAAPLCDATEIWTPLMRSLRPSATWITSDAACFLHDPLTVALLVDPTLVRLERLRLRAEIIDGAFRLAEDHTAAEIEVAVDVDAARAKDLILRRIGC